MNYYDYYRYIPELGVMKVHLLSSALTMLLVRELGSKVKDVSLLQLSYLADFDLP